MEHAIRLSSAEGLVGREAELALAAAAVRELNAGRASVLAIEGEAGIGKTRLVQGIVDDARSRDLAVFSGQIWGHEFPEPQLCIEATEVYESHTSCPCAARPALDIHGVLRNACIAGPAPVRVLALRTARTVEGT